MTVEFKQIEPIPSELLIELGNHKWLLLGNIWNILNIILKCFASSFHYCLTFFCSGLIIYRNNIKSLFSWCISCFHVSGSSTIQPPGTYDFSLVLLKCVTVHISPLTDFCGFLKGNLDQGSPNAGYVLLMFYHLYEGKVFCTIISILIP